MQAQGGRGAGPAGYAPLAHPELVSRTHFPRDSTSLAHSSEEGHPLSGAVVVSNEVKLLRYCT